MGLILFKGGGGGGEEGVLEACKGPLKGLFGGDLKHAGGFEVNQKPKQANCDTPNFGGLGFGVLGIGFSVTGFSTSQAHEVRASMTCASVWGSTFLSPSRASMV